MPQNQISSFADAVGNRYHIYNSLFLKLPFHGISRTGTLLPLLLNHCDEGFANNKSPREILNSFFDEYAASLKPDDRTALLFDIVRFVERQVVLFDSIEDAAFGEVQDIQGAGTVGSLLIRARAEQKEKELLEKLTNFSVRVVLTAHPTQFYPGPVLGILTDLEQAIRDSDLQQINLLLHQLGKTKFFKKIKPTPFEEAQTLTWYLENVFYQSIAKIILQLCQGLGIEPENWTNTRLFTIGFWPGGDRDGNPFVTSATTLQVAEHLRERIIRNYFNEVRQLKRRLTFKGVDEIINRIEQRLIYNMQKRDTGYRFASELYDDLEQARKVLIQDHDGLFADQLDAVLLKVRIFGFHFAGIEIRQHADKHTAIWRATLGEQEWDRMSEDQRLEAVLSAPAPVLKEDALREEIAAFSTIRRIQKDSGEAACNRYIISNCGSALNVIAVFRLAQHFTSESGKLNLDIIPLFESIEDLAMASHVMQQLYSVKAYREHLVARGNKQVIMLGFSDGTKDGGYLRANWSIYRAKEALTQISKQNDIIPIFFDGRGGPPARGGGNTHDFYASLGPTIESKEIQITIQGQTISSNFGRQASCSYNLEQLLSAGIEQDVFGPKATFTEEELKLMDKLAEAGYQAYLGLKTHPDFVPYLQEVTPLPYFGDSNIGSRPVKRNNSEALKLQDLRAIPFVGTWAQMKQNIPGFYGVGSAILQLGEAGLKDDLQRLFQKSLFLRTLLGNSMMALTKTFYPATAHLEDDERFGPIWKKMFAEYQLSKKLILEVAGVQKLMQNTPAIRESIKLRERIVLPLIAIQQYALQQVRKNEDPTGAYKTLIIRCMFGIINAARNSA
jgi:phosphoenolpyruvate carboxylase